MFGHSSLKRKKSKATSTFAVDEFLFADLRCLLFYYWVKIFAIAVYYKYKSAMTICKIIYFFKVFILNTSIGAYCSPDVKWLIATHRYHRKSKFPLWMFHPSNREILLLRDGNWVSRKPNWWLSNERTQNSIINKNAALQHHVLMILLKNT